MAAAFLRKAQWHKAIMENNKKNSSLKNKTAEVMVTRTTIKKRVTLRLKPLTASAVYLVINALMSWANGRKFKIYWRSTNQKEIEIKL